MFLFFLQHSSPKICIQIVRLTWSNHSKLYQLSYSIFYRKCIQTLLLYPLTLHFICFQPFTFFKWYACLHCLLYLDFWTLQHFPLCRWNINHNYNIQLYTNNINPVHIITIHIKRNCIHSPCTYSSRPLSDWELLRSLHCHCGHKVWCSVSWSSIVSLNISLVTLLPVLSHDHALILNEIFLKNKFLFITLHDSTQPFFCRKCIFYFHTSRLWVHWLFEERSVGLVCL